MMRMHLYLSTLVFHMLIFQVAATPLRVAFPMGNNAVVQHGLPVPIRGTAPPNTLIQLHFGSYSTTALSNEKGLWRIIMPAQKTTRPPFRGVSLKLIAGSQTMIYRNILIGDVWVASGQSNMAWPLRDSTHGVEAATKALDPGLRLVRFHSRLQPDSHKYSRKFLMELTPENLYQSRGWYQSGENDTADYSAIAYHFARSLREQTGVPIGVIQLAVGGSPIEAHMPRDVFEVDPRLRPLLASWWTNPCYPSWCRERATHNLSNWFSNRPEGQAPPHPFAPGFLWQAGIKPLTNNPIKGIIWYQGESNAGKAGSREATTDGSLNKHKFKTLIAAWRHAWGNGKLPVYYVQLPSLNRNWKIFREMQLHVANEIEHGGMAVTIDIGHPTNVHPTLKKPVGERLARLALARTYHRKLTPCGPVYKGFSIKKQTVTLKFSYADMLQSSDGKPLRGFTIAGAERIFHPAKTRINGNTVLVWCDQVKRPHAVRYAWANSADANLVNSANLPASPFRTDRWKITPGDN